jgi:hypothetical protein
MSGSAGFGGQGKPGFSQMAESDEALRTRTSTRSVEASEAEGQQGITWGQGDVATRRGSVWKTGAGVVQLVRARPGAKGETGGSGGGRPLTISSVPEDKQQIHARRSPLVERRATVGEGESRKTVEAGGREDTARQRKRSTKGEELTESGGLVNPVTKESKVAVTVRDVEGDASSGLRRSSRAKSSWTPFPKEDCCTRRKALGELS